MKREMVGRKGIADAPESLDLSPRAQMIGRMIDRLCRRPGEYQVAITVPVHRRAPWTIQFLRLERLQRIDIGRR
jgi:hypothetical protein